MIISYPKSPLSLPPKAFRAAVAATDRLGASVDRLANSNEELVATDAQVAAVSERSTRYKISAAAAAERIQRQIDQEYRAQKLMAEALRDLERARQQGIISASREAELITLAQQKYGGLTAGVTRAGAANENFHRSAGITANQLQNISYQLQDAAVQLQGGQSPFTVLLQQGSQLQPVLSETGIGGAIRGVGSAIGRFITPATATFALLTGAVVYGYSAWSRYDDATRKVGVTLAGLGRETGLTREGFERLATTAAAAGNISVKAAGDLGATFAATGKIGPDNIARLITVAKDAAATFGTDLDGIKDKLATSFSSAAGITALNDQMQFLDARTLRVIQSLFQAGKEQDAIRMAIERLPAALAKAEISQGAMARAWEAIKTAASDADTAIGRFLDRLTKGPGPEDRLKALQQRIEALKAAEAENLVQPGGTSRSYQPPTSPTVSSTTAVPLPPSRPTELQAAQSDLQKYMEALAETKRRELEVAAQKELEASLNRKSNELKKLTEEAGLGSDNWRKYKDLQIAADEALKSGDPALMKRVDSVKDLSEASSILEHVVKSSSTAEGERMTAAEKAAEQRRLDTASTRAVTVEEKARVAQMQTEARQRGQLITVQQAQAEAEHAAQQIREQADQQLRLMIRDQGLEAEEIRKRTALIGLDAEARAVATARQRTEQDLTRQGVDLNGELARSVIAGAEANARLGVAYDKATEAQQRMRDAQREIATQFSSFIDDALLGTGKLTDAFKSMSKTFASGSLKAILTGEGALAGMFGTAPTERGQIGGLLGGGLDLKKLLDFDGLGKAVGSGAESGITSAFAPLLKPQSNAEGKALGFMTSPMGKALSAGAAGASVGYSSANPLLGGGAGALAGFMTGDPLAAVAGGVLGFIGGSYGHAPSRKKDRANERRKRLREFASCGDADGLQPLHT